MTTSTGKKFCFALVAALALVCVGCGGGGGGDDGGSGGSTPACTYPAGGGGSAPGALAPGQTFTFTSGGGDTLTFTVTATGEATYVYDSTNDAEDEAGFGTFVLDANASNLEIDARVLPNGAGATEKQIVLCLTFDTATTGNANDSDGGSWSFMLS